MGTWQPRTGHTGHPAEGSLEKVSEPGWASGSVCKAEPSHPPAGLLLGRKGSSQWKAGADRFPGEKNEDPSH